MTSVATQEATMRFASGLTRDEFSRDARSPPAGEKGGWPNGWRRHRRSRDEAGQGAKTELTQEAGSDACVTHASDR